MKSGIKFSTAKVRFRRRVRSDEPRRRNHASAGPEAIMRLQRIRSAATRRAVASSAMTSSSESVGGTHRVAPHAPQCGDL